VAAYTRTLDWLLLEKVMLHSFNIRADERLGFLNHLGQILEDKLALDFRVLPAKLGQIVTSASANVD
jgi:hypothetical protein